MKTIARTLQSVNTVSPSVEGTLSLGAKIFRKTPTFQSEPMRLGQKVALLGKGYSAQGGMRVEYFKLGLPSAYPRKPIRLIDSESRGSTDSPSKQRSKSPARETHHRLALDSTTADALFELLADYWIDDTRFDASFARILSHPAVRSLIAVGKPLVPLALRRLEAEPERWSYVLAQITGAQPLPIDAQPEDAVGIWSEWLKQHGWI